MEGLKTLTRSPFQIFHVLQALIDLSLKECRQQEEITFLNIYAPN